MILVTTAGKVGSEAARPPAGQGVPARAPVRDPAKAAALARAGVEVAEGAAVAAQIAVSPAVHAGKAHWPTGPEAITFSDAAAALSKAPGRLVTFQPLTVEEQTQAMIDAGPPESLAAMNAQAVALSAEGGSDYVTGDVPAILGRPARTFEQFAADHAAAFSRRRAPAQYHP